MNVEMDKDKTWTQGPFFPHPLPFGPGLWITYNVDLVNGPPIFVPQGKKKVKRKAYKKACKFPYVKLYRYVAVHMQYKFQPWNSLKLTLTWLDTQRTFAWLLATDISLNSK